MNFWERWIGDWKRKTAHLSAEAKGIYGELLDHEYATHKPLPLEHEDVCRIAGARTTSECRAVEKVLAEFYIKTEHGYSNKRAQEEILKRESYVNGQRERANRRWHKEEIEPETGEIKPNPMTEYRKQAAEIIAFLNAKAERNFDGNGANADHIIARLKDGETMEDLRAVVAKKCREWRGDEKMSLYLRPATLFNRTKFASYKGELDASA